MSPSGASARYLLVETGGTGIRIERRRVTFDRKRLIKTFLKRKVPARAEIFSAFYGIDPDADVS